MFDRFFHNWVYGGGLAGVLLLLLLPAIDNGWSLALMLVFLQMPVYMLHQLEEHDDERFRRYVDEMIGHGRDVLPSSAVFVINIGVWVLNLISFAMAAHAGIGWGLIGVYAMVVNAIVHIADGVAKRAWNPGLVTAIVLFLPVGLGGLWAISATGEASAMQHIVGLVAAVLIHAGIVAYVLGNVRRLGVTKAA
jgi:hypothetical protein